MSKGRYDETFAGEDAENVAFPFNCTPAGRTSVSMTVPTNKHLSIAEMVRVWCCVFGQAH